MRMYKYFFAILISIAILAGCSEEPSNTEFPLGIVLPLTGNYAEYGLRVKRGVDLAVDEINSGGGIGGRQIRSVVEDTASEAKNAVSALNKLVATDNVHFVIGEVSSTNTLAMIPVAEQNKVFLFAPVSSSPKLTGISKLFARNWPADNAEAAAMAEYAKAQGKTRAAVLYVDLDYGIGLAENFKKKFESLGGGVVAYEGYKEDTANFRVQAQKVKDAGADVIFLGGYHKDMARATKAVREALGENILILAGTDYEVEEVLHIAGKGAEAVVYGTPKFDTSSLEASVRSFVDAYRKKYSRDPSLFEANAYDAVRLITSLVQKVGEDPIKVGEAIRKVSGYKGASGTYSFQPDGDVAREIALKTVRNGKFVFLP